MSVPLNKASMRLRVREFREWAERRGFGAGTELDEGAALHSLLTEAFGVRVLRPFRLMAFNEQFGELHAYTKSSPEDLSWSLKAMSPPEHVSLLDGGLACSAPLPEWRVGDRVGFDLKARPLRRVKRFDSQRYVELDYHDRSNKDRCESYTQWLIRKLEGRADVEEESVRLVRFRETSSLRGGSRFKGPDATLVGNLTVRDPDGFMDVLSNGVGRHKAYGYGMLLLRQPQKTPT